MKLNNKSLQHDLMVGRMKEESFKKLFPHTTWATTEEDIHQHWDFKVDFKVDVKGLKKFRRKDNTTNENIHWIELKNVLGAPGWLYGLADFFAFETNKYWIVVEKRKLQDWVAENIIKDLVSPPEMYKLYRRPTGRDIITVVSTHDLYYLSEVVLQKES